MRLLQSSNDAIIIDDSYNSSPVALHEALRALEELRVRGKKIAVLGDMLELGNYSTDAHKKAGKKTAEVVDLLITVGIRAREIAKGAHREKLYKRSIFEFDSLEQVSEKLKSILEPGDAVLIKGSQSMRMEKIVEEIMAEPERKKELLVRQDKEWLNR